MKKIVAYILVLLLLLTACYPTGIPSDSEQEDPSLQDTTEPWPDPANRPEDVLSADDCLLTERETLTYEEFFGEDRVYADDAFFGRTDWIIPSGGEAIAFSVKISIFEDAFYIASPHFGEKRYVIPGAYAYVREYKLLSADGKYAYFQNTEEIVQLDMRTGAARQIVRCDYISNAYICGRDALYYAGVTDGKLAINRLYIPTMQLDVLYDDFPADMPYGQNEFYLYKPTSTQGDVVWYCLNPAMIEELRKEIANPDSRYRTQDFAVLWETPDLSDPTLSQERLQLCNIIQEDTGVRAILKVAHHQATGENSERLGVIDNCWFGSGYPHDHYAPEKTREEAPVPADGQWVDIPNLVPIRGEVSAVAYSDRFMPYTLYCYDNGVLGEKLIETPVVSVYGAFCVTEDNRLIQIGSDGSVYSTLYQVKDEIRELEQFKDRLYFLDGNTMVELDLSEGKYRVIVEYTNIVEMYVDNAGTDEAFAEIYFVAAQGLFVEGYLYVSESDEIFVAGYRL